MARRTRQLLRGFKARPVLRQRLFAVADLGNDLKSLMGVLEMMMSAAARSSVISKSSSARCSDSSG